MKTIDESIICQDQPIDSASLMGENRYLTSWIDSSNLEIQQAYKQLTEGIASQTDRIIAVWEFVRDIPYTAYIKSRVMVDNRVFTSSDVWLDAGQALKAKKLNCMNKSVLLANLLRQELPAENVWVCLNNVNVNGTDGHAVGYLRLGEDYLLETTNPEIRSPFLQASDMDIYESVIWMNDKEVRCIPNTALREPFSICCVRWLSEYINERLCDSYV